LTIQAYNAIDKLVLRFELTCWIHYYITFIHTVPGEREGCNWHIWNCSSTNKQRHRYFPTRQSTGGLLT